MASISSSNTSPQRPMQDPTATAANADPRYAFRNSLSRCSFATLRAIAELRGLESEAVRASTLAGELTEQLDEPAVLAAIRKELSDDAQSALGLFGLTDTTRWPLSGLKHALSALGVSAEGVVVGLLERGLLAIDPGQTLEPAADILALLAAASVGDADVLVHPALTSGARTRPPTGSALPVSGPIGQIREPDGLEPILRLAALWQRLGAEPLRRTQQGTLYKRDRERIEEDAVLAGPVSDALADLPAMATLWLGLAQRVGVVHLDSGKEYLLASPAEFWSENAVHLPQMIASAWLGMRTWREWAEPTTEDPALGAPLVYLRPSLLLWLSSLDAESWVTIDDMAEHLDANAPGWDRITFQDTAASAAATARRAKAGGKRSQQVPRDVQARRVLERILLGGGYAMGLIRVAQETATSRNAVQLTELGRYVLAIGPPPPPRPTFDHFLFVQPNLEVIAYRQGLTPPLIGWLSRFAWWTKIGAAMELRLTQESIGLGLDWGLSVAQILEILARHSQRALPSAVKDAVERWASRRERVTFYEAATLIEFGTRHDRDQAAEAWSEPDGDNQTFVPVGDRFLLVENAQKVPTGKISTSAVRDYRLPPDRCVAVEADGVTLTLDPSRSDLLIDAELARFSDEEPAVSSGRAGASRPAARRFMISASSLSRGVDMGLTPQLLADWFTRRTGVDLPPAVKLMVRTTLPGAKPWKAHRRIVLNAPSAELMDGVLQHPITRPLLGDRLGPISAVVPDECVDQLRAALKDLGIEIDLS